MNLKKIISIIRYVNIVFLLFLTLLTLIDVVSRYIFHVSVLDTITLSSYLLCMINILALSDVTYSKRHVTVEIIYDKFSPWIKKIADIFIYGISFILFSLMSISSFIKTTYCFEKGIYKGWMEIPESPVKLIFTIGCILTALTFLSLFAEKIRKKKDD